MAFYMCVMFHVSPVHVQQNYGIAAMDQVWLPLQDLEDVRDCIRFESQVQMLVEVKLNAGVQKILPGLHRNLPRRESGLFLEHGRLRDVDAKQVANALKVNTTVAELFLDDNSIGDVGCTALAHVLKVNHNTEPRVLPYKLAATVHVPSNLASLTTQKYRFPIPWIKAPTTPGTEQGLAKKG
jgi:hypothetical protein